MPARRKLLSILGLGLLAAASLRPVPPLEGLADALFLPARLVGELAAPGRWLRRGELLAAERASVSGLAEEALEIAALLEAEERHALPLRELAAGRSLVHGEVVRRDAERPDRVFVRLATLEGIEPGLPVVAGQSFVGRVESLPADRPGEALVALVTAADVFVGAEVIEPAGPEGASVPNCRLVVGGLAPEVPGDPRGALFLAVHSPSRHSVLSGEVHVREPEFLDDPFAHLARGFLLGGLEPHAHAGGGVLRRVRPVLDYRGGLSQVLVVRPEGAWPGEVRLSLDTLDPARWRRVRALADEGVARGRSARLLAAGSAAGAREGAALTSGAWLVGRIGRVAPLTSVARLLTDPGLSVPVIARLAGEERPRALGELVSLGRGADGALRLAWDAGRGLDLEQGLDLELGTDLHGEPDGPRGARARLYTGSGHEGVPRGLLIGDAWLPAAPGRHALAIERDAVHDRVRDPWLWIAGTHGVRP